MNIKISGIGSYIPEKSVSNTDFSDHVFLNEDGSPFGYPNEVVVNKFKSITGIENRRYANNQYTSSDLGFFAAQKAIANANIDPETIDYIIFAHNFGDVKHGTIQSDMLPSLATRVKHKLQIQNPKCVAYDLLLVVLVGLKVSYKPTLLSNRAWQNVVWLLVGKLCQEL